MSATPVSIITSAVGDLSSDVTGLAPVGLGVGVLVFAITFGWRFVKKLAR